MYLNDSPEARQLQTDIGAGYDPVAGSRMLAQRMDLSTIQRQIAAARNRRDAFREGSPLAAPHVAEVARLSRELDRRRVARRALTGKGQ